VVDEGKRHGQRHALYLRARPPGNIPEYWRNPGCPVRVAVTPTMTPDERPAAAGLTVCL
jgi:hypothetical protein